VSIHKTKYPVVFDSSKFDYYYDPTTFESESVTDVENIIESEYGRVYNLYRVGQTTDSMGKATAITDTGHRLTALMQDITAKDLDIHDMGLAVPGNKKMFLRPVYTETSGGVDSTFSVQEGDILFDEDEIRWRVEQIVGERHLGGTEVFRVAVVRNIDLKGSQ